MTDKKKNILFVAYTYAYIWILALLLVGGVTTGILASDNTTMMIAVVIGAWAPTVSLLLLFKKLFPKGSIKNFYRNAFQERINISLVLVITVVQLVVFILASGMVSFTTGGTFSGLFDLSLQTIGMGFVWTLTQGATGEESGWRGYLQPSVEKKHGVITSSLIVGFIWCFWHIPQWLVTSGLSGTELLQYILAFMVAIVSTAIVMGICYKCCRNLFVPMWIHFMFNLPFGIYAGDRLAIFTWLAVFHTITAIGYSIWFLHTSKKA